MTPESARSPRSDGLARSVEANTPHPPLPATALIEESEPAATSNTQPPLIQNQNQQPPPGMAAALTYSTQDPPMQVDGPLRDLLKLARERDREHSAVLVLGSPAVTCPGLHNPISQPRP